MTRRGLFGWITAAVAAAGFFRRGEAAPSAAAPARPAPAQRPYIVERPVFACIGETVTCENGHPICDFAVTVHIGDMQDLPNQLVNWRQPAPALGTTPPGCSRCGARWWGGATGSFHFPNGWR